MLWSIGGLILRGIAEGMSEEISEVNTSSKMPEAFSRRIREEISKERLEWSSKNL